MEITTTVTWGAKGSANDGCSRFVTVKNSEGEPLGGTELQVDSCGEASLRSGRVWRLLDGGHLAAFEFGSELRTDAASDLHMVYLGRDGGVWKLADFDVGGSHGSSPSEDGPAKAAIRVFQIGSSTVVSVSKPLGTDWLEFPPKRDALRPLSEEGVRACTKKDELEEEALAPGAATESFLRAYHDSGLISFREPSGLILFDEPLPVAWSSLAPRDLVELELPEIQRIYGDEAGVRDYCRCAQVEYTAPLPAELANHSCQLLTSDGISLLTLLALRGTVSLNLESSGAIAKRTHYGEITAKQLEESRELRGGFVVCSPTGAPINAAAGSVEITNLVHSTSERPEKHDVLPEGASGAEQAFWTIESQYAFELGGSKFAFIAWSPDKDMHELGCSFRYSIAVLGEPSELVAWNNYGCDV